MPEKHTITWLHISDLHFQSGQRWEQAIVLKALLRDVLLPLTDNMKPDFVFVTGDIANSGRAAEYTEAQRFFAELAQATRTDPKMSWFLVPGNHDVDRALVKPLTRITAAALRDTHQVSGVLGDSSSIALFAQRQSAFFEFTTTFLGADRAWSSAAPWRVERRNVAGLEIAIAGLNSAWSAEGGDQDQGRLLLGEFQVRDALGIADREPPALKIVLMHHPLDWLRSFDQERVRSLLMGPGGAHFLLRGHLHKSRIASRESPDASCVELAAGALWEEATFPHGVALVQLDISSAHATVHLFRYSSEARGFWKPDNFLYENINDGTYTFALPRTWQISGRKPAGISPPPAAASSTERRPSLEVNLDVEWDRKGYQAETDLCRALITIQVEDPAEAGRDNQVRKPVHHILVLDMSRSMNEEKKYPLLVAAVDAYLRLLSPHDLVSLIPFSTESEILVRSLAVSQLRQYSFSAARALSTWPFRFGATHMAPALRLALTEIERAKSVGFDGVERLLCLTDGQLQDYMACRPVALKIGQQSVSLNLFGFGEDFDAESAEALAAESEGTVRYVRTIGTELEEYFGHMARTSQRIVLRDATITLRVTPGVTCFNVFACRPQERHIGKFDDVTTPVISYKVRAVRYGSPYIFLFELRPWEARQTLGSLTFEASDSTEPIQLSIELSPQFAQESGEVNDFVQKMAASVGALVRSDSDTQIAALQARIKLYSREGRPPQHIEALERQLEVLRRGGSPSELSKDDQRYLNADVGTATSVVLGPADD
ncbi:MAG TPA: metallophosphoesterase [Thermoanaerobaculia bacterium]